MILTADSTRIALIETETREYEIEGSPDQLDELEVLLDWIGYLGSVGHTATAEVSVDGDGKANLKVVKPELKSVEGHSGYNADAYDKPELSIGIGT